jgi:heme exporter protein C
MKRDRTFTISMILLGVVLVNLSRGLWRAPVDVNQGEIYRIIFLHVPSAMAAFCSAFVLLVASVIALLRRNYAALQIQKAACEIGLAFTIITLITGAIWGRPTWGVWWVWDARLTTTLILALLFSGYLLIYMNSNPGDGRLRTSSILGIIIAIDVPIIYKSVDWWRTIHQGHSLFEKGKDPMNGEIKQILLTCMVSMLVYASWLIVQRFRTLQKQEQIEQLSLEQL